jgi:hypothetical protein
MLSFGEHQVNINPRAAAGRRCWRTDGYARLQYIVNLKEAVSDALLGGTEGISMVTAS